MVFALLTSFFWAISAVCGQRAARALGSLRANAYRLTLACLLLGAWTALFYRDTFHSGPSQTLIWSGIIGFGIGDVALYLALARIGSRLTVLITFCLAPIIAATIEWAWLGETISPQQFISVVAILLGVGLTIEPSSPDSQRYGRFGVGLVMGLISAAGQGLGAVMSRIANQEASELGVTIPAISQAFHRVSAGWVIALLFLAFLSLKKHTHQAPKESNGERPIRPIWWLWASALGGPIIGVALYQQALQNISSGMVLAIVSMTPILVIPFAFWLEQDRPSPRQYLGAVIASSALVALLQVS